MKWIKEKWFKSINYYLGVLKKYAVISGRATREEYWYFTLFSTFILIVLLFSMLLSFLFVAVYYIYYLAMLIPTFTVGVRRLHDIGKSGWWMAFFFIPFGPLVLLIFFLEKSEPNKNQYGSNPKISKEVGNDENK